MGNTRDRFTVADLEFLSEVLAGDDNKGCMLKLWEDPDALREMLDLKEVFRAVLDSPSTLRVSPAFYFYIVVRHAFVQADIQDVDMADYVAGVFSSRVGMRSSDPFQDISRGYTHASDFLAVISSAHGKLKFHLQIAAGNQFLVLTGLYPSYIEKRNQRSGAPDIHFYESFASRAYQSAADNPYSRESAIPRKVLGSLAEIMPQARRSLNRVAEEFVFLGE